MRLLRGLVDLIAEEADRNPGFAEKLEELLAPASSKKRSKVARQTSGVDTDVPDVYRERELRGQREFLFWLYTLPVPVLRAIIRRHDLDSTRRTMKWKDTEKLGAYIAERLEGRLERGGSFMRENQNSEK